MLAAYLWPGWSFGCCEARGQGEYRFLPGYARHQESFRADSADNRIAKGRLEPGRLEHTESAVEIALSPDSYGGYFAHRTRRTRPFSGGQSQRRQQTAAVTIFW